MGWVRLWWQELNKYIGELNKKVHVAIKDLVESYARGKYEPVVEARSKSIFNASGGQVDITDADAQLYLSKVEAKAIDDVTT